MVPYAEAISMSDHVQSVRDAMQHCDDGLISVHELGHKLIEYGQLIVMQAHDAGESDGDVDVDEDDDVYERDDQPDTVDELGPTL